MLVLVVCVFPGSDIYSGCLLTGTSLDSHIALGVEWAQYFFVEVLILQNTLCRVFLCHSPDSCPVVEATLKANHL